MVILSDPVKASMSQPVQLHLARANNLSLQSMGLHIAEMADNHLSQIVAIEQLTSKYPWDENQFDSELSSTVVLMHKHIIVGFAVLALVADQAELHNIAIHPQRQKQGLGSIFLRALIDAMPIVIKMLYLEVRVTNFPAIRLYYQLGFTKIAQRRDYYRSEGGSEDALVMSKVL